MPQILTISFVPDGTMVGTGSSDLSSFATKTWGPDWEREALRALQTWVTHAQTNVGIQTDDGEPLGSPGLRQGSNNFGDIRVAAVPMSSDVIASAVPFDPAAGTWSGEVLLNSAYSGTASNVYSVFLHEFGHVFGFADNFDPTSVNYRYFAGPQSDLSASDVVALQSLYGARQPDAYEGALGNDTPATATPLTFKPGEHSQTLAADITTASDVDNYLVALPAGSNEFKVNLKTSGLSLLTGTLTVFDAGGSVVGSASATDPRSGDLTVLLAHASPGQTYRVSVRAADPAFGVGQYALSIETDSAEVSTPPSAFLKDFGSTYLLSILSDGVSSNPSGFQAILRLLFAGGGNPSLYSDSVKDGLAAYLAQAGSTPQGAQSVGTLLTQILAAQGSSQLNPSQFGPVLDLLNKSGVMKQVVSDLIKSGSLDQVVGSVISSGRLGDVFQSLIDSGALKHVLRGAIDSPQGPALLSEISNILLQTFFALPGTGNARSGRPVLTSQNMLVFYTILLDNHALDPVIDSFLDSGLLYNSFASVSPEALNRSLGITLGLAAQPNHLGAELRQFFGQSGVKLAPGPVTPAEGVAMIRALRGTGFFDEYYRALMNAGGLDEISVQLAASGGLDKVFTSYLTSQQVGDLFGAIVKSDLLPVLAQTGVLDGMIRSAIEAGAIGPLLASMNKLGALPGLTVALLNSGTIGPLFNALMTSDKFSGVLIQMFEAGQLGPITQELASTGALADAINGLVSSGQFPAFIGDILSVNSPVAISALDDLARQLLPSAATSFDDALPLAATTASTVNGVWSFSGVGVLGDANPKSIYKLVVPTTPDGTPATMIVGVWRQKDTTIRPHLSIFDEQHRPVAFQLLNNKDGDYVVQVLNPTPGHAYYVMISEAAAVGTGDQGVFGIQAIFNDKPIQMDEIASRTIDAGTHQVETTFVATDARVYHWVLNSDTAAGSDGDGGVMLTVLDSSGRTIESLEAPAGKGVSLDLLLNQGTYTLVFSRQDQATSSTSSLGFTLSGFELSDLMKPYSTDTSLQPVGTDVATSSQSLGGSTTSGLARIDPTSHSYMATFGNQGGVEGVNVTIARGPRGPLRTLAARGQVAKDQGGPVAQTTLPAVVDGVTGWPIDAQVAVPPGWGASPGGMSAEALWLAASGAGHGGWDALKQAAEQAASALPRLDPDPIGDGPSVLTGQEYPHFLTGMILIGGTAVGLKLRKKKGLARRRDDQEAPGLGHATPDGSKGDSRSSGAGRPSNLPLPRRVLLVESPETASSADRLPFEGWLADDGVEVLKCDRADWSGIVARRPELVLLEHRPPSFDALDALHRLRAHALARSIPVILISGHEPSIVAKGLDLGAFDVLAPSVGAEEFRARLGAAMRLSGRLSNLEFEASRDGLTGLANRSAFEARLARDWSSCEEENLPLTLILVDIDRFKTINDVHGHAVGDEAIRHVASTIALSIRDGDLAARLGGDEFVLLAPGCDQPGAEFMAERVRRRIENLALDGVSGLHRVTVSVGIACIAEPARTDPEEILRRADQALYAAKSAGRNAVRSWDDIRSQGHDPAPSWVGSAHGQP
jgi:diguanylate cyclase (GGDEF)-like protein